ncbi:MAG: single-stranded-DNA-specific exonuclease RecJ [Syntrophales bacterium]|nr:single-stranded-DNA-specific exonuclease RecJ [Syntrophales bacterium]
MSEIRDLPVTQWRFSSGNDGLCDQIERELRLLPVMTRIMANRGLANVDDARRYLYPSLRDLHNPFLMKDMDKGVRRIIKAIFGKEGIMIYGDYDADGITSVVALFKFLKLTTDNVRYYIPDRIEEGYGLNRRAIDRMKDMGVALILTVDCGISDAEHVAYAKARGMDVIILDHHEVPATIPDAVAVINPNRQDCRYPFRYLAGVGIAFNFLIALRGRLRQEGFWSRRPYPNLREYLDLVALGTIGDISPLTGENRIFVKIGLDLITEDRRVGIRALKEICGMENQAIDTNKASFCLIPRINAAGRVGSPREAVDLLLTDNIEEAREIARRLDGYNRKRQAMEKAILQDILDEIKKNIDPSTRRSLVFASRDWHPGVIGIVASRLVDRYCRPAILISLKDGIGKGSGRSIGHFNIYEGLRKCESLLLSYGGHQFAAGISIKEEDIDEFSRLLDEIIEADIDMDSMVSQTMIDTECQLCDVNHELLAQISLLAPFGSGNPEPILCVRQVNVTATGVVGNNHLRMRVCGDGVVCNSIWFSQGQFFNHVHRSVSDIAFTPQINYWNGASEIQLKVRDMALHRGH